MSKNSPSAKSILSFKAIVVITIMAVLLAFLTTMNRIGTDYSVSEGATSIIANSCVINEISEEFLRQKQNETYTYSVTGEDPWVMYEGLNDSYKGVLISLANNNDRDFEVKVYWTRENDAALSESRSKTVAFSKGRNNCYIKLPSYPINFLRIDISANCELKDIALLKNSPKFSYSVDFKFMAAFVISFLLIFVVLYFAACSHYERVKAGGRFFRGMFINESVKDGYMYEYDYIRTLAALLVIMMHSVIENFAPSVTIGQPGYFTLKLVLALSTVCNVLYVMLSGALLLKPKDESIRDFYTKRLARVCIPTLSYYLLYMLLGFRTEVFKNGIWEGIKEILTGLASGRPEHMLHMWFIYAILGLYILAPFWRIVISKISEGTLFGLILTGFLLNCLSSYLPLIGIKFGIDTSIIGWTGVFLLGYYMTTEHARKRFAWFLCLGVAGMAATVAVIYYRPDLLFYFSNQTPLEWLFGAGIFAFFTHFGCFKRRNIVVESISKYNFSIMLIHVLLLMKFILPIGWGLQMDYGHLRICIVGIIATCFVLSYVLSVFYDNTAIAAANYIYSKLCNRKK